MKHRSPRQVFALILGVFLALGMTLSAVQAAEMSVQMAMMADAGASGQGGCDGCGNGEDGTDAVACPSVLFCSGVAVLPVERGVSTNRSSKLFVLISVPARDFAAHPDPYPPRSVKLG